jgi:hypothetical protein
MATIINDNRFEESPEFFEAILTIVPTERVTVSPERTTIQIFDNSSKLFLLPVAGIHFVGLS